MNTRDAVRKLLAFSAGKPLPHGTKLCLPRRAPNETLVISFVRMGGESRPWGVAFGPPDKDPQILSVPEARDRELVGAMLEQFTPALLKHLGHPGYVSNQERLLPFVWLPNASHVEMLHFLAFTYTFAKKGEPQRMLALNALGRAANWLFQESTRPGQISCVDASRALRDAFTFPAENVRQAHTAYLLAWLESKGGFNKRLSAASLAEQRAVSTSLDPKIEKENLIKKVEDFNEAKRAENSAKMRQTTRYIQAALEDELRYRFEVTVRAIRVLAEDDRAINPGVDELKVMAHESHQEYLKIEEDLASVGKAWLKSPETDRHSLIAASQYITLRAHGDRSVNTLVHYDEDLQEDFLAAGDGLRGTILTVHDERVGRKSHPVWVVQEDCERPLRVRERDTMVLAGNAKLKAELRSVIKAKVGSRQFELEIVNGKRSAIDLNWRGQTITFLNLNDPGFAFMKRKMLWDRNGPGTWLTHKQPWDGWETKGSEDDRDIDAATA